MKIRARLVCTTVGLVLAGAGALRAQTQAPVPEPSPPAATQPADGWRVTVYPVLAWVPSGIDIEVDLPPVDGGGGGGGSIVDPRFDGAFLGGLSIAKGPWRLDTDGVWAAVGGDRSESPTLTVDADVIYFHASGGYRVFKDLYVTGGVRRLALKYDVKLADAPNFQRKPGVWDPLVGVAWHGDAGKHFEVHATFEGGGFGVGADTELAGSFRLDWKPFTHFGFTGGYNLLYFKVTDTVASKTFEVKQTLQGPVVGVGLYF